MDQSRALSPEYGPLRRASVGRITTGIHQEHSYIVVSWWHSTRSNSLNFYQPYLCQNILRCVPDEKHPFF